MPLGKVSLVGVRPGDPELITRKAERVVRAADLLYHPGADERAGFAIRIVQGLLGPNTVVRGVPVEMAEQPDRYRTLAAELAALARAGRRVAYITEGDPLVYSTASRLLSVLRVDWPDVPVEIVPGVTSLTAVAAAAGRSLVESNETLVIIPACHHPDRLEELIDGHDRVALLKVGSVFSRIVALVRRRGWLGRAIYAEKVGTSEERVVQDIAAIDPSGISYFSMILLDTPQV